MENGKYIVFFNRPEIQKREKVGEFEIKNNVVTISNGICKDIVPVGPLTERIVIRIMYSLNNGYYSIHKIPDEDLAKNKNLTNKWYIKIKNVPGWHEVKTIIPPEDEDDVDNVYVLENGDHIPQKYVEDLRINK